MSALQLTPAEWLLAGLLVAVLVLQAWLLLRGGAAERRLREGLGDDLGDLMEQRLAARHRELLLDLHDGLSRQTDRIGEHARADRELLQRGLTSASLQLSRGMQALTQSVDGRLDTLSGQVNQRLDEGFRKTNETFASVMARLATIDEAQKKIDGLTTNVVSLQELLGDKRARGAFGEVQLENLVRNMLPPEAFAFQQVLPNGTRVDCLLTLPAPTGNVAVDAKFPLENYHRMFDDALAELDRRAAQQAFRADVKRHVDAISSKYILPGSTADGAVMFLPAEAVFAELHAYHPEVVAYAQHKRVWIVSPTTLMAVLNTARAVMKDVETRKQIHVIQDALGKLAKDFQRFDERMAALARHIEQASRDVQDVHTSSRKISAHFRRIESVQLDEEDEGGGAGAPAALTGGAPEGGGAGGGEGWNSATVGNPSVAAAVEPRVTGGRE
ncbi:DNA recombination protein RmuC [Thauera sp.]|uniref:DNA recombination protein RmuC n=1 Tax=Thauera sp. TaxID=1905334 RepID=UPI002C48B003|nr:DNA recombination protein RmuC [Thauera sp.]HRO35542.1 DNA recombination protein RmuC [Thauera sp.]